MRLAAVLALIAAALLFLHKASPPPADVGRSFVFDEVEVVGHRPPEALAAAGHRR